MVYRGKDMKMPDFNKESSHKTNIFNTLTLSGLSVLWGVMLNLISPWWLIASILLLLAGYGNEIEPRKKNTLSL